jgi:hypothetical protein
MGPLEFVVIAFPGNRFSGEILPELNRLRDTGIIRIIDLLFVTKLGSNELSIIELSDLPGDEQGHYESLFGDLAGLLTREDVHALSDQIPPDSSAAIVLFEHSWATNLRTAIVNAGGELIAQQRIPPDVVQELADELAAAQEAARQPNPA